MITAKPLRVKHLQRQVRPEIMLDSNPEPYRIHTGLEPDLYRITPKENYVEIEEKKPLNIKGKIRKLLKVIVNSGHGMEAYEITSVMTEFCKAKNCFPIPDMNSVAAHLKRLYDAGEITRVKIDDRPFLYYKRY